MNLKSEFGLVPDLGEPQFTVKPIGARPKAIRLFDARRLGADHPSMLFHNRVLKKGESWLVNAATGVGKSVLAVECAMCWALGRSHLGFEPVRPLRSLIFVAEDDQDEMAWFRDGIANNHGFTSEECAEISERVHFLEVRDLTGAEFINRDVLPSAAAFRPDLLLLNPALAYIGAEANDQKQVASFLRNGWQPALDRIGAGSFVFHHTAKPSTNRLDQRTRFVTDLSYAGLGSVEWANWARGILTIQPTVTPGVFKIFCPKRGQRLGWRDPQGNPTSVRLIAHSTEPGMLGWRDVEEAEIVHHVGRPKGANAEAVLSLLTGTTLKSKEWQVAADIELGVKRTRFHEILRELERAGRIVSTPNGWRENDSNPPQKSGKSEKSENNIREPSPESPPPKGGRTADFPNSGRARGSIPPVYQ